jgi:hypothetical protein
MVEYGTLSAIGNRGKIAMEICDISPGFIRGFMAEGRDLTKPYVEADKKRVGQVQKRQLRQNRGRRL